MRTVENLRNWTVIRGTLGAFLALLALVHPTWTQAQGDQSDADRGRLAISILDDSGAEISTERYLAVVPMAAPWRKPSAEKLFEEGSPTAVVAWDLKNGSYRVVCSARGYWVSYGEPFELQAGEERLVECVPISTEVVQGRILAAATGEPVQGVEVGPAGLFTPDSDTRLSALGQEHLRRTSLGRTREDGTYELFRPIGYSAALWAEKPGWNPAFRPSAVPEDSTGEWPLLKLVPGGGSLRLVVATPATFSRNRHRLLLLPLGKGKGASIPSQFQDIPFPEGEEVTWSSLPVGRYAVLLSSNESPASSETPIALGTVDVQGETLLTRRRERSLQPRAGR